MIRRRFDVVPLVISCDWCGVDVEYVAPSFGAVRADLESDGWRFAVTDGHTTDRCPGCAG